jgi:hypothetical protein
MPIRMSFDHDVFISYNRADLAWAQRLNDALVQAAPAGGEVPFFAPGSLRAGDNWEAEVQKALLASRHLIVLWSDQAKASDWVTREFVTFYTVARPNADSSRRLVFLNLQGANSAFTQMQQINLAGIQHSYASGTAATPADWAGLMLKVRQGLDPEMRPLQVPVVVLAMTRNEFDHLEPKRRQWIQSDFHVSTQRLALQYGSARRDWCPFGRGQPVDAVLSEAAQIVDQAIKGRRCEWVQPGDEFWNDKAEAKSFVEQTFRTGELSLLLIDPASLSHPDVFERLMLFQQCLASPTTVIATLAPFGAPRRLLGLKAALRLRATPYFDDYLQPTVPPLRRVTAQCSWNAVDADDIGRQLLAAAAQRGGDTAANARPAFLQHGGP